MLNELAAGVCEPCQAGAPTLSDEDLAALLNALPHWSVVESEGIKQLRREYRFGDFSEAKRFVNRIAEIAEAEGHHPALLLEWGKTTVSWWTHKIKGIHRNDVIMAAKTETAFEH